MTTLEALRKARALIVERGWIQGDAKSPAGYCVTGSICEAAGSWDGCADQSCASCVATRAIGGVVGTPYVIEWNDAPGRTKAEVLAAFDRAILHEEAKEAPAQPVAREREAVRCG